MNVNVDFQFFSVIEMPCKYFVIVCSSDMVKISMDTFVKRFQPDKYFAWINGQDIGPHPEDPPSAAKPAPLPSDQDILVNKKYVRFWVFFALRIIRSNQFN